MVIDFDNFLQVFIMFLRGDLCRPIIPFGRINSCSAFLIKVHVGNVIKDTLLDVILSHPDVTGIIFLKGNRVVLQRHQALGIFGWLYHRKDWPARSGASHKFIYCYCLLVRWATLSQRVHAELSDEDFVSIKSADT